MSAPHQHFPYFKYRSVKTGTFTAANSLIVTDGDVRENSIILIQHTSGAQGNWYVTVPAGGGSFTVRSSVVEDGLPTFNYEIF